MARSKKTKPPELIIGVDGEGQDTPDGRHIYTYLAAVDENGVLQGEAWNGNGLSHEECVRMLLGLPKEALKFGFMFSYDVTKIIEELPLIDRYYLMRPQLRDETSCAACRSKSGGAWSVCPRCGSTDIRKTTASILYMGRRYGFFNGSLTVEQRKLKTKIWDCFRFFGCSFVNALEDWGIGSPEQVARIKAMKDKRGSFDVEEPSAIRAYCQEECHLLALMMRKVKQAHEDAGIALTHFYGAGSTASALLKKNEVAEHRGPRFKEYEPELGHAVACAFFGGRFEDSMVGIVRRPVHSYDISSAYPFAMTALPCLRCGSWRLEKKISIRQLEEASLAVAAFRVGNVSQKERRKIAWGPLPFRDKKGSISYGVNFTGWAWRPEILAALRGWPDLVSLVGPAWIYKTECAHQPFAWLPTVYRKRVEWGKEGAGKALKLGSNASYGKLAQSIGDDPPFQCWPWAGAITATTRGQLLGAIASASDRWNVLTVATDGAQSLEELLIKEAPWKTGTDDLPKPLGGWEHKELSEGVFVVKPGLYYRLQPKLADVRARGIGRRELFTSRDLLEEGFLRWNRSDPKFHIAVQSRRFYGAKHSIYVRSRCLKCNVSWPGVPEQGCPKCHSIAGELTSKLMEEDDGIAAYGRWGLKTIKIGFDPFPKREREGLSSSGTWSRLTLRDLEGEASKAYAVGQGKTSPEGVEARLAKEMMLEQPDWEEEAN